MKIALTSIPKSGTHLLAKVIENITREYCVTLRKDMDFSSRFARKAMRRKVVGGHLRINQIMSHNFFPYFSDRKIIVLIRDPRDICNSMLDYIEKSAIHKHVIASEYIGDLSYENKIRQIAKGISTCGFNNIIPPIDVVCHGFLEVLGEFPDSLVVRYEDFFDIDKISNMLGDFLYIDRAVAQDAVHSALNFDTKTKNVGRPNRWMNNFSLDLREYFRDNHSSTIENMGYSF